MLDAICNIVAKIVFSGVDGRVLVIPLIILIYVLFGQAKEFIGELKSIVREGEVE